MCFAIRREVGFQTYQQDLQGLQGAPIELALPYKLEEYLKGTGNLGALAAFVKNAGISCPSVHAPQGRLTDDNFLFWARDVVLFAETVGALSLVFHPENVPVLERPNLQRQAVLHLRQLQRQTKLRVAVETFGNRKRVLTPEEVEEREMWMVLDTSHLFLDRIHALIERYHRGIAAVHLSELRKDEKGEQRPHLPIETYGLDVLRLLQEKGWSGTVTLEYLPDYHDRLLPDRQALEGLFH
jgi:sugar phosphate isomerase/epimerase